MSLALVVLFESNWLQADGAKLFFFASCFVALLVLGHYLSRKSESSCTNTGKAVTTTPPDAEPVEPEPEPEESAEATEDEQGESENPEDSDWFPPVRTVAFSLRQIQFKSFDVETGPPDPECFCDKVTVEINYRQGIMPWDFAVATPKGLEAWFKDKNWYTVFVGDTLIVPRYDAERITAALMKYIKTNLESVPEEVAEDEMKEADPAT